jgi:glutathione S-transferase
MNTPSLIVYGHPLSGHVHRVELFLSLLGLPFERRLVDLVRGEHKRPEFLAMNPLGQVPVLVDADTVLADSNAILVYLNKKYGHSRWLPDDPVTAARIQRWFSIAAGELVQGPALARRATLFRNADPKPHQNRSGLLLGMLENQLTETPYLVGAHPTLADIALFSYIALAPEGDIGLGDYPAIRGWLGRIEALPHYLPAVQAREFLAAG